MPHEIAKLLLENANSFLARKDAVQTALNLGMPLHEIEHYLDWLEMTRLDPQKAIDGTASSVPFGSPAPEKID